MKNIYLCGPTVYGPTHIGNIRPILVFDIFIRALKFLKHQVNFIHNITDIDDKIIAQAQREHLTEKIIADKYKKHYLQILKSLNVLKPNAMPTVVDNIKLIQQFIQRLIDHHYAYVSDGDVYFDTQKFQAYGQVSHQKMDDLILQKNTNKHHPADFALWKKTEVGIKFAAPWSMGRPGWHTECAAFIDKYTTKVLDYHGGGNDLLFPHHENENAQYQALYNRPITQHWKHIGQVVIDGQKMSKSLGNVIDAQGFIQKYGGDTLRTLFLLTNATRPINVTNSIITHAYEMNVKFKKAFMQAQAHLTSLKITPETREIAEDLAGWNFTQAMAKFNHMIKTFNKNTTNFNCSMIINTVQLLGFNFSKQKILSIDKKLLIKWKKLRQQKQFADADLIRQKLIAKGLI